MNNTGICAIHRNGEEVSLLFGMPALEYFQNKVFDGSVLTDDQGNTVGNVSVAFLLHAGYWNYCIANGYSPKKKIGDFLAWLEENIGNPGIQVDLDAAALCFRESKSLVKYKERIQQAVEDAKKKLTGKE